MVKILKMECIIEFEMLEGESVDAAEFRFLDYPLGCGEVVLDILYSEEIEEEDLDEAI